MPKSKELLHYMTLSGTKKGTLSITHIEKPHGERSAPVVSVGVSLKGDNEQPDWQAMIPYENLDEVIHWLLEAKKRYSKLDSSSEEGI